MVFFENEIPVRQTNRKCELSHLWNETVRSALSCPTPRERPIILLELLSGTHENPGADAAAICESFGYEAFIVQRGEKIAALPAITALGKNTSWGTNIESRNVLFLPR